ncbi:hypothetical protein FPRO05_07857 [Fusarium proliferatum]|uniref:Uncharacterized protein n=1 Tax=Gibberella intermedia TaxID=948311 RepID=A0A365NL84_GIBIN|nr:hypothetical protein FPRO05_07857 [Fusarium proliferatum]
MNSLKGPSASDSLSYHHNSEDNESGADSKNPLYEESISLAHVVVEYVVNPLKEKIADLSGRLPVCEAAVAAANQATKEAKKETKEAKNLKDELKLSQVKIDLCVSWISLADKKKKEQKKKKKEQGQPAGDEMEVETEKEMDVEQMEETEVSKDF